MKQVWIWLAFALLLVVSITALTVSIPHATSIVGMAIHHLITIAAVLLLVLMLFALAVIARMMRVWLANGDWQSELRKSTFWIAKLLSGNRR